MIDKPVINTDLKKYDKAYVVEDDILWEVFGDGYSQAEVIWDKENICELLNEQQATINKLNDENNLLQEVLTENEKMLGKDLDMLTKLRKENKKKDIEIELLNAHITNWLNETKIAKLYQNEQYKTENLEKENKQLRQQLQEYKENWDDLVELATKTSLRNVELDEQIGQLRKELNDCEKFRYTVFKRMGELNDE